MTNYVHFLIPETVNVTLYSKRDFAVMIKDFDIDYPGLSGWVINITTVFKRDRGRSDCKGSGDVMDLMML